MTAIYSKERAKYGSLTGQIIIWPVEYSGSPDDAGNVKNLPAGYLKCDGTKYLARDYPALASILGTGSNTSYKRTNIDGSELTSVGDEEFVVPDFGSKYAEPTSGANVGQYNDIRKENKSGVEKSRSGIGIETEVMQGTNGVIPVTYSGKISVPSQEIPIPGKPSYTYASVTHYTASSTVDETQIHPHAHTHRAIKCRVMTTHADGTSPSETNDTPKKFGYTGRRTATTVDIEDWLDRSRFNNNADENLNGGDNGNPDGLGQGTCKAIEQWDPNDGTPWDSGPIFQPSPPANNTVYWGGCIRGFDKTRGDVDSGSANPDYWFGCILNKNTNYDRRKTWGSPNGSTTIMKKNTWPIPVLGTVTGWGCIGETGVGPANQAATGIAWTTYSAGLEGVPEDWTGASLADVLPMQMNEDVTTKRVTTDVTHDYTVTNDLVQTGDPTSHTHRVDLDPDATINGGEHSYKVKTRALELDPELLTTTITVGTDPSHSIDSSTSPFIVMEYLIKI